MRIGIDCRTIVDHADGQLSGVGNYTFSLVNSLSTEFPEHQFQLFVYSRDSVSDSLSLLLRRDNVDIVPIAENGSIPFVTSHWSLAKAAERAQCDVFHSPAYVTPWFMKIPTVVTVHDLAIYEHPEWFAAQSPISRRVLVPRSVRRAAHVIAVSEHTKEKIHEFFTLEDERVQVVYEAAVISQMMTQELDSIMRGLREYYYLPDDFFFFVGTVEPRKNLVRTIEAFEKTILALRAADDPRAAELELVIAGRLGWKYEAVQAAATTSSVARQIRFIDYVSEGEKMALIVHARALLMPSLDEGFGLPAVEAMSVGTPVIASRLGALPEVTGGHALLIDPYDINDISAAMVRVLQQPHTVKHLVDSATDFVQRFSWQKTAQMTMEVYQNVQQATRL